MFNSSSSCPTAFTGEPTPGTYQVLQSVNADTATAFHQQVQAALPAGCRVNTSGDSYGHMRAIVYAGDTGEQLAYCSGDAADVLAQIESQRAALAQMSR